MTGKQQALDVVKVQIAVLRELLGRAPESVALVVSGDWQIDLPAERARPMLNQWLEALETDRVVLESQVRA